MRKSLIAIAALLFSCMVGNAQIVVSSTTATSYTIREPRQTGLFININAAITPIKEGAGIHACFDAGTIVGWQLTPNLGLGLGAAYRGGRNYFGFNDNFYSMYDELHPTLLPVFITARLHLTNWNNQPFIGLRLGVPIGISDMASTQYNSTYPDYPCTLSAKGKVYFAIELGESFGDFDVNLYYEKYTASLEQVYREDDGTVIDEREGSSSMSGFGIRLAYNLRPKKNN